MAVVATAERGLIVYQLENQPSEFRRIESPLKHQVSHVTRTHILTSLCHTSLHDWDTIVLPNTCKHFLFF